MGVCGGGGERESERGVSPSVYIIKSALTVVKCLWGGSLIRRLPLRRKRGAKDGNPVHYQGSC